MTEDEQTPLHHIDAGVDEGGPEPHNVDDESELPAKLAAPASEVKPSATTRLINVFKPVLDVAYPWSTLTAVYGFIIAGESTFKRGRELKTDLESPRSCDGTLPSLSMA
jgi:hypothetical protein